MMKKNFKKVVMCVAFVASMFAGVQSTSAQSVDYLIQSAENGNEDAIALLEQIVSKAK